MARTSKFETAFLDTFDRVDPLLRGVALDLIRAHHRRDTVALDNLLDNIKAVQALDRQCYNPPGRQYRLMTALNALLGTHGCEPLGEVHHIDGPPWEYLNVGDPYTPTLVWYRSSGRFYIRCYGDIVEAYRLR